MRLEEPGPHEGVSRREFLEYFAAANGVLLAGSRGLWAAERDPRVADIVAQTITVDMHNHWSAPGGDPGDNQDREGDDVDAVAVPQLFQLLAADFLVNFMKDIGHEGLRTG